MHTDYSTPRLVLQKPVETDALFFLHLLNTTGWLQFIGDRHVKTETEAHAHLEKIRNNPQVHYWVAKTREAKTPLGIVTLTKKDYLEHWDIGFAFLPEHGKQGFATEAVNAILNAAKNVHTQLLAVTRPDNSASIKLLVTLGLTFAKSIHVHKEQLLLYESRLNVQDNQ